MSNSSPSSIYPKDIDLNNCDNEPIHLVGRIQNHGVLLAIDKETMLINRCSENCAILFSKKASELLNTPIQNIISNNILTSIFENFDDNKVNFTPGEINNQLVDVITHTINDEYLLEFEFQSKIDDSLQRQLMLTEVISSDHLQSWLGLNYPSTDIPVPARKLFAYNIVRIIKEVAADTVPILSKSNLNAQKDLDLSRSELRAVSPIHIEYLTNMKVGATLTLPILMGDTVWGLVSCHHYNSRHISYRDRLSCKFITQFFANQLQINKSESLLQNIKDSSFIRSELINQIINSWNIPKGLLSEKYTLNNLANCTGAAIVIENKVYSIGECPTEGQVIDLIDKVRLMTTNQIYYTNELEKITPTANAYKNIASGVMIAFISKVKDDALLWFKPEENKTVFWAGKPTKNSTTDKSSRLSPRKSFEKWQENQAGKSKPWSDIEIAAIEEFRNNIIHFVNQKYDEIKSLNVKLRKAYVELESYSYSISHDLRAPLRGIDGFAQIIKEDYYDTLDNFGKTSIETIINSVKKMNMLIDDILAYSGIEQKSLQYQKLSIKDIIRDDINNLSKEYPKTNIIFETTLPNIYADKIMITQLFRNLLGNAFKYASKKENPEIKIGALPENVFYITDNGVGFDQKQSEKIFKVFNRLHDDEFEGTGIGLAIAKRVVNRHNGEIWTESQEGKGATFYFKLNQENNQ